MARSRKKTPISGATTARSDKPFKTREHRRERHTVKTALSVGSQVPHSKEFGDPWKSEKDGKIYWADDASMRK